MRASFQTVEQALGIRLPDLLREFLLEANGGSVILAPMNELRPLIAVLHHELQFCKALARLLKTHGFEVVTFTTGEEFFASCASRLPDHLLLDLHMPGLNGFDVLERVSKRRVPVPVITGHDQRRASAEPEQLGLFSQTGQ